MPDTPTPEQVRNLQAAQRVAQALSLENTNLKFEVEKMRGTLAEKEMEVEQIKAELAEAKKPKPAAPKRKTKTGTGGDK